MGRKNGRKERKGEGGHNKVRYREKGIREWRCRVCEQRYNESQTYCESCYQSLYYFSYINNQMFVAKDESYLEMYFSQHSEDSTSFSSES